MRAKLEIRLLKLVAAFVVLFAGLQPVVAQSVNIDLGYPGNGPPSHYRAAGLPGYWHSLETTEWGVFHDLNGLDGQPIAARVRQIGGTEIVETIPFGPTGNDAVLLGDALVTHAVENCLFFENLQSGTYEVLSYTWMPTVPTTLNHVWIDFHPYEPFIGGSWTGELAENIVFARHEFEVTDGVINMHSGIPSGGNAFPGAALNGIQLRLMTPEPTLYMTSSELDWLEALDAVRYDIVRGDLQTLNASGGDFTAATEDCLAINIASTEFPWSADPPSGQGDWFLVRGRAGATGNTWNAPGSSQVGSRDLEIGAAVSCP